MEKEKKLNRNLVRFMYLNDVPHPIKKIYEKKKAGAGVFILYF